MSILGTIKLPKVNKNLRMYNIRIIDRCINDVHVKPYDKTTEVYFNTIKRLSSTYVFLFYTCKIKINKKRYGVLLLVRVRLSMLLYNYFYIKIF